jgi:hypothetical protein
MRTWADWDNNAPGFIEVDLVGHDGGDLNGEHCYTLTCTDIATGWTETRTVRNRAAKWVFTALVELQAQFPFPILGIDSDNGSEFINSHLLRWCHDQQITFTRSRPNNKNDGAHVEQKNWTIVRRTAGYWRYHTPGELRVLNQIWTTLSPLTNLFTPSQKTCFQDPHRRQSNQEIRPGPNALPAAPRPPGRARRHRRQTAGQAPGHHQPRRPTPSDRRPPRRPTEQGQKQEHHPPRQAERRLPLAGKNG